MKMSSRMFLVRVMGMFVYIFVMSSDASLVFVEKGVSFRLLINWTVFLMLNANGRGDNILSLSLKSLASLYKD